MAENPAASDLLVVDVGKQEAWSWNTDWENPVAPPQLAAQVSRPSSQDEGDKNPLSILPADYVEAQAGGALVQHHLSRLPAKRRDGVKDKTAVIMTQRDDQNCKIIMQKNTEAFSDSHLWFGLFMILKCQVHSV